MTDPTPQAGQCKCGHHINFHSTMRRLDCLTYGCSCAAFTPAEPSPAPPAEDDLTQLYEEAKRNGAGTYSGSHIIPLIEALTAAREERDREAEYALKCDQLRWSAEEERDRLSSHYSDAKELIQRMMKEEEVLREERDRAQDALREAREFIENQQFPDGEWSRVLDVIVWWIIAALMCISIACDIKGFSYPVGSPWLEHGLGWVTMGQIILIAVIFIGVASMILSPNRRSSANRAEGRQG